MSRDKQPEFEQARLWFFKEVLQRVDAGAALHGISTTDALNQAALLWAILAELHLIGDEKKFYIFQEVPVKPSWWDKLLGRSPRRYVALAECTAPGISLDKTIVTLLSQQDEA